MITSKFELYKLFVNNNTKPGGYHAVRLAVPPFLTQNCKLGVSSELFTQAVMNLKHTNKSPGFNSASHNYR